jgi:hypothetical protein
MNLITQEREENKKHNNNLNLKSWRIGKVEP